MTLEKVFQVAGSIVVLATVFTVITSKQTASIIQAASGGFAGALRAAMGK
jgi:hypothetical protein